MAEAALPAKPRVVVGLDFGTTYSGFAFAHVSNSDAIYSFYDYPKAVESSRGAGPKARWKLQSWGYPARTDFELDIQALHKNQKLQETPTPNAGFDKPSSAGSSLGVKKVLSRFKLFGSLDASEPGASDGVGVFLKRFKLHLASRSTEASSATPLPPGLTIVQVITDYLRELGGLILKHLQSKYGAHFSNEMIQWCITVPSIWDNSVKATMKTCMAAAGLEVVELGCRVKEVTVSSGGFCGGTYVDSRFMEFLEGRVGEACVAECILKHRNVYGQLMKEWECTKSYFVCNQSVTTMNLPNKLSAGWESSDVESGHPGRQEYDELEISSKEMQAILDPGVQQNVELIQRQMVEARGKVRVLAMVGGFSESPYLLCRMRVAFGSSAEVIICPPNSGSAICQGAVALALNPNDVMSRICKRTYGCVVMEPFKKGIDPIEFRITRYDLSQWCQNIFVALVKKGDVVVLDEASTTMMQPFMQGSKAFEVELFSCDERLPPRYITDKGVQKEGKLVMDISKDMELDEL